MQVIRDIFCQCQLNGSLLSKAWPEKSCDAAGTIKDKISKRNQLCGFQSGTIKIVFKLITLSGKYLI